MKRVLIIDDEDDIREVASISLEVTTGWEILGASSGPEGLEIAMHERLDVILLDVLMPGMDGPATVKQLQENAVTSHIPIVLLTARVQGIEQKRLSGLAVAGVLSKPFDPLMLAAQISEVLGWPKQM